ncbi:aldehyde dehydrogenase [Dactylosporangium sp. NPDC005572]|uniref:aldehyde dehydrogenase n=1 Tax=Dactylosporangium sp. NPDC005572 TaxID=3156889 RepID=UPI0033AABE7B
MNDRYLMFIDGQWRPAASGRFFDSIDPWTQQPWAQVAEGDSEDVATAVNAARWALEETPWTRRPHERAKLLRRLADLIDDNAERLAAVESRDNGKTIREERAMYGAVGGYFRHAASLAETIADESPRGLNPDVVALTRRVPFGVIGIQTPWNTPGVIMAQSAGPALAAGNTIVVKPSEQAPCSTLEIAKLAHQAGFPPGVFNVVTGFGPTVGAALCTNAGVDKLVFTGSPEGGRIVAAHAAQRLVPVTMELGGKAANVVFADADIAKAAQAVAQGFTAAGGQSCQCGSRALIEASVYEEVLHRVVEYVTKLTFGDPSDPATDVGPMCNGAQLQRVEKYVAIGREQGGRVLCGGGPPAGVDHPLFYAPTIFTGVTSDMTICQEEIFGPVLAAMPFETEADAIRIANDTRFGLSAAVWSRDLNRAHRVARSLRAGVVWVNNYRRGDPAFPMGGMGESGYGRVSGTEGYREMTQAQSIQMLLDEVAP